jgi:16S rRNA (cytosine967-C5)-methyltransferase
MVLAHSRELDALAERDRALATRLIYGTLQMEGTLDAALACVSEKGRITAPPHVVDSLRLGAYQLLFTDIPPHAVVDETVGAIKTVPAARWRALANGLLRRLSEERDGFPWMERAADPCAWLAMKYGHPEWLVKRFVWAYGEAETEAILAADNEPPQTHIRTNTLVTTPSALMEKLASRGYKVRPGRFPEGIVVEGPPGVWREPELGHEFIVQDGGSLMAPTLLAPKSGERVLDMAAGRGGKATHMAALMADQGEIVVLDLFADKARQCGEAVRAASVHIVTCNVGDARTWETPDTFDAVLVDAPCSGTGTLRRRAELRWRRKPEDIERLVRLQGELLVAAAGHVRPGGRILYATCSLLPEENAEQVDDFLASEAGSGWTLVHSEQLLPSMGDTDGHFAALLERSAG